MLLSSQLDIETPRSSCFEAGKEERTKPGHVLLILNPALKGSTLFKNVLDFSHVTCNHIRCSFLSNLLWSTTCYTRECLGIGWGPSCVSLFFLSLCSGGMPLVARSMAVVMLSIAASFAASVGTALLVHLSGHTLSWYTSSWLLVPLYYAPSLVGMAAVHLWWKRAVSNRSLQSSHM